MNQPKDPIILFQRWYNAELKQTKVQIPSAVCLSTIGIDNFPNARFVSLKEINENTFIITGPLDSRKGIEIQQNNNVALPFWWTETERQVRIQGTASRFEDQLAKVYYEERSKKSKVVSAICKQGMEIENVEILKHKIDRLIKNNKNISKPEHWGGFSIKPIRIEFMEFKSSRFHDSVLYEFDNERWHCKYIHP